MNIALGQSVLLLALLGAVAGAVTLIVGLARGRPSLLRAGQVYIWLVVGGAVLATAAMQRALITHDFTLSYVDSNDSTFTPLIYRITAMWSDLAGSILLGAWSFPATWPPCGYASGTEPTNPPSYGRKWSATSSPPSSSA